MKGFRDLYKKNTELILKEICEALNAVDMDALEQLAADICNSGRVFLTGTGRVFISLQAFCKRLAHLGICVHCVGDITEPALSPGNLLIVASGSGESIVPVAIAKKAKALGAKVVHIGSNREGSMKQYRDYMVRIPVKTRLGKPDEVESGQIMTSLFEQVILILGDILSLIIIEQKKIEPDKLWLNHANIE